MAGAGEGMEPMSVSIAGGPATAVFLNQVDPTSASGRFGVLTSLPSNLARKHVAIFKQPAGSEPEQIIQQLNTIAATGSINHLVIACEADRPLMAYASLFTDPGRLSHRLARVAFVIKASTLLDLENMSCFLAEQIEFAGDLFLEFESNDPDFDRARTIALILNPSAQISSLDRAAVTKWCDHHETSFDFDKAWNGAGWRKLIDGEQSMARAGDRITAFGYRARRPFHPERFWNLLQKDLRGVFRAKGFFWLATRMDQVGGLNLAGSELHCASAGNWWAARDQHVRESEMPERTRKEWTEPFGDRRQSFAIIAFDVEEDRLQAQLDGCLLTETEMRDGPDGWRQLPDPFPSWSHAHHRHDHEHEHGCEHHHDADEHDCCHH